MSVRVTDSNGKSLGSLGDGQTEDVLQAYADLKRTTLTLTDRETGEVVKTLYPKKRAHNAYSFDRVLVSVRVHPDDRQQILDAAKILNNVRQEQAG